MVFYNDERQLLNISKAVSGNRLFLSAIWMEYSTFISAFSLSLN